MPGIDKTYRKKSKPICVEISPTGDFSQNKKTNKYLLCAMCPVDIVEIVKNNGAKNGKQIKLGEYSLLVKESFVPKKKSYFASILITLLQ